MNNVEKKRSEIKNGIFNLLNKHPYSMVRTKVDRMGRQLMEIDNKFAKTSTD